MIYDGRFNLNLQHAYPKKIETSYHVYNFVLKENNNTNLEWGEGFYISNERGKCFTLNHTTTDSLNQSL